MNKYRAIKCEVDGIVFDSRREARRWRELQVLVKLGKISNLRRQVRFVLIPAQYEQYERYGKKGQRLKDGRRLLERECAYVADFVYEYSDRTVVEDTKGVRTKDFLIKKKLMLWVHGIRVREV